MGILTLRELWEPFSDLALQLQFLSAGYVCVFVE